MRFLFCLALSLMGCSTATTVADEPLQGRYWRAVEIEGKPVSVTRDPAEPHVVLAEDMRAYGSDGCNSFTGSYTLSPGLHFDQLASTMMACLPSINVMASEFSSALASTANYQTNGKQMLLRDAAGRVRLRLEATLLK